MPPLLSGYITSQRLQAVQPYLNGSILDIGCGYTRIPQLLRSDQTYVGVDISTRALNWLHNSYPQHTFFQRDLNQDQLALPECYQTILMAAVLEHLRTPLNLFRQLGALLQPGGCIVVTTPTPLGGFVHAVGSRLGLFYQEAADEHEAFYTQTTLNQLAAESSLIMIQYRKFLFLGNQLAVFRSKDGQIE